MTSEAIKVDTRQYRRKHGHEPCGRFLWTFRYGGTRLWFSMRGEYQDCLAEAIRRAREKGATAISVSSVVYGQDEETELEEEARLDAERQSEEAEEGHNWG
jgi:hypothetical protein